MVTTAPPPAEADPQHATDGVDRALVLLRAAVIAAPDRIVTAFLSAAIPVGLAVTFRVFTPALVVPAAVLFVVAFWFVTPSNFLAGRGRRFHQNTADPQPAARPAGRAAAGAVLAGVAVLAWMWVNHSYTAQYVVLQRDPGIYTLRAMWLMHHSSPLIDMSAESAAIGGVPGASTSALAFPATGTTVYPQSSGLLPGLLAVAGWVGGLTGVLKGDLVIGAVALLSVYAFARRLLGPLWALVPLGALAACMPMVAFARAPYSEPVALAATFGGLTVLWIAWESQKLSRFAVAGVLLGVGSLARIDGGAALIGVLGGFGLVTLGTRSGPGRRRAALQATVFFVGAAAMNALGLLDSSRNSPVYLASESHNVYPLAAATIVAWVVVVALAFIPLGPVRDWLAGSRAQVSRIALALGLLIGVVMISRPLWWTARFNAGNPAMEAPVRGMQINNNLPLDPGRTYDESTVNWLGMYLGWITVVLAALGAAMLLARIARARDPRLAMFVMTVAAVSLLYLNRVSIFPDQIWAMRRFLPVVLPGLLVAAAYPLVRLARARPAAGWVAIGLGAVVVAGAMVPWAGPVWTVANGAGQVQEMNRGCATVAGRPVVLTGKNPGSAWFLPTFKIGCGVPTVQYVDATPTGLAKIRANYGVEVAVVTFDPASVTWTTGTAPAPVNAATIPNWSQPLQRVPDSAGLTQRVMFAGIVQPDGTVAPLAPPQ